MLACLLRQVRDVYPGARICVISFNPSVTEGLHGVPSVSTRSRKVLSALAETDIVILGPGGILHDARQPGFDRHQSGISFYTALAAEAVASGRTVAALGIGAGPLTTPTASRLTHELSTIADPLVVRDGRSRELMGAGIVAPDIGWLLDWTEIRSNAESDDGRHIAVAVREWGTREDTETIARTVSATIDRLFAAQRVDTVRFVSMEQGVHATDGAFGDRIISMTAFADRCSVVVPQTIDEAAKHFAGATMALAMRFHAALLAIGANRPTVALAYDAKVTHLMEAAGLAGSCFALDAGADALVTALTAPAASPDTVDSLTDTAQATYRRAMLTLRPPSKELSKPSFIRYFKHRSLTALGIRRAR